MANIIVSLILLFSVGGAGYYIYKNKKKGVRCIGCAYAKSCSGGCSGTSNH